MRVKLEEVCKRIYAGGDVPKDRFSEEKTEEYPVPIYANAEKDNGLYGYTDKAREEELSITVAARGTIGFTAIRREPFLPVVRLITVVPDTEKVSVRYLYYVLKNCKPQSSGTSIPQLTVPDIKKNSLELYDISEQERIADQLDRANRVIELRKQELESLDELIKARFVEMFGDYHTNSKNFESHKGSELFKFSSGKFLPEEKRFEEGIPVYGGNGIAWYTDNALIDYPTIIIGRVGAWCGNIHTVSEPVWITDNAIFIKEQYTDKFTLEFLTEMMKIMDFHQYADFSGQPKITQKPLETLEYLTPPIEMQNEFTEFCKQVDKSKVVVQKALDEAQLLFDSLMQEYFG